MPAENGSVTPSVAAAATAASTALPPRRRTSRPTAVAVASTVETAPPYPYAVGPSGAAPAAPAGAAVTPMVVRVSAAVAASAVVRRNRIDPPGGEVDGPPLPTGPH